MTNIVFFRPITPETFPAVYKKKKRKSSGTILPVAWKEEKSIKYKTRPQNSKSPDVLKNPPQWRLRVHSLHHFNFSIFCNKTPKIK